MSGFYCIKTPFGVWMESKKELIEQNIAYREGTVFALGCLRKALRYLDNSEIENIRLCIHDAQDLLVNALDRGYGGKKYVVESGEEYYGLRENRPDGLSREW
jgi:hypothetical protein